MPSPFLRIDGSKRRAWLRVSALVGRGTLPGPRLLMGMREIAELLPESPRVDEARAGAELSLQAE
jgi:hypothetical protein